jgi:hypothetical protein
MLMVDVDAFCKLAHWNILPHLPGLTGIPWQRIATISSLLHRAQRATAKPDMKIFHTSQAARLAVESMGYMGKLGKPVPESLVLLEGVSQIDVGEAVLFSLLMDNHESCLLTGDKKALKSLATLDCADRVSGRIITIEQIMLICLKKMGEEWFKSNVCPFKDIDTSIRLVMGSCCQHAGINLIEGLLSFINEIMRLRVPPLLKDNEPLSNY